MLRFADCCSFLHTGMAWQSYEYIQMRHWRSWKLSPEVLLTSSAYFLKTHVLPLPLGSFAARPSPRRHQVREGTSATVTGERRPRLLNLQTYKLHALGDYAAHIRMYGTTDSYSTQVVSLCCDWCLILHSYTATRVSLNIALANIDL